MNGSRGGGHALVPARIYFCVWAALVVLTAATVGVSYVDMKNVGVLTALLIAGVKASLVILYFMHIRFERAVFVYMIFAVIATYVIFIGLTFADYYYR